MKEENNSVLLTMPAGSLMLKYSLPCIVSLLVAALYNIVDQIFIANASYLGSYGNAANTVVYPLTVIALAFAVLIGDGCCSFVSISLGKGEKDKASFSVGSAILLSIIVSLIITVIYIVFMDQIILAFGGGVNGETFLYAKEYLFYIALGIPFYIFGQAMNPIIRADGSPRFAMVATIAGAGANIILDPIFIFTFHFGMMGAAVATVIGQFLTALLSLWYILNMKSLKIEKKSFSPHIMMTMKYLSLGLCSLLSQISLVASMVAMNNMIRKYGALDSVFSINEYAQIPMAVIGIVMKFFQIIISISIGLAAGCIPVVGFNMGAGRRDRAKKLFSYLISSLLAVGFIGLIIVEFFPSQITALFGSANESEYYLEYAIKCFRLYLCMLPLACLNKGTFIFLQALGKALQSTLLSLSRELVFGVGFALILPLFFSLDGVLYSMPAADILTFIIALVLIVKTYSELSARDMEAQKR